MPDDTSAEPVRKIDDATYGRPPEGALKRGFFRAKRWFLLDADRRLVAGVLLGGTFLSITLVGAFGPVTVQSFLAQGVSPGAVLVELLKSIVSVVVIVLSINQLVLSPGLGPVGEQRERYEQSIDLRERAEALTGVRVSPSSPAVFLAVLLDAIVEQADTLEAVATRVGSPALVADVGAFTDPVVAEATAVRPMVSEGRFGRFEVISASMRFAISDKVRSLHSIDRSAETTPDALSDALDEMDDLLELFTVAREYLKTIYIREAYISLSDGLLYTALPAIVATYCAAQIYTPTVFPGELFGIEHRLLFVTGAVTVALTPLVLLIAYIFRLTALSRSTLFVGPFDAHQTENDRDEFHGHGR